MLQLKFHSLLTVFAGILASSLTGFGQIMISPSSASIINDTSGSAQFRVLGIPADTPIFPTLKYLSNEASGWASVIVSDTNVTLQLNGDSSFPQDPNGGPLQGTYGLYLIVQVGAVIYKASLLVYLFPTDNQFLFADSSGKDLNAENGGLALTSSSLSQSVYILYANLDTNLSQKETFQLGSDSSWLTVSPTSGQTPTQFIVQADPSGLRPSSTPYEGFILVNDTGNQNQNAKLPVHFLVQGAPIGQQLNTDASSVGFSYGTADVNNGANGFLVTVPDANTQLTVSATANQPIQIYARFGSDVVLNGSAVTSDTMSSQGTTASITLGTTTQPVLHAGTWYIAIQTFSNELTTGYIDASLTHPACTYALSDKSTVIEAGAGIGSLTLNTQGGCDWSASSDSPWLRITDGVSGTGTGRVDYAYDANTGPARTGNILAGGLTFSVTQASGQISAPQIESFIATPSSISYGSSAKLSWSVVSAESVMIDQGIGVV